MCWARIRLTKFLFLLILPWWIGSLFSCLQALDFIDHQDPPILRWDMRIPVDFTDNAVRYVTIGSGRSLSELPSQISQRREELGLSPAIPLDHQGDFFENLSWKIGRVGLERSPFPGRITRVNVHVGQRVQAGDHLLTIEAMKMEMMLRASSAGEVDSISIEEGDIVDGNATLLRKLDWEDIPQAQLRENREILIALFPWAIPPDPSDPPPPIDPPPADASPVEAPPLVESSPLVVFSPLVEPSLPIEPALLDDVSFPVEPTVPMVSTSPVEPSPVEPPPQIEPSLFIETSPSMEISPSIEITSPLEVLPDIESTSSEDAVNDAIENANQPEEILEEVSLPSPTPALKKNLRPKFTSLSPNDTALNQETSFGSEPKNTFSPFIFANSTPAHNQNVIMNLSLPDPQVNKTLSVGQPQLWHPNKNLMPLPRGQHVQNLTIKDEKNPELHEKPPILKSTELSTQNQMNKFMGASDSSLMKWTKWLCGLIFLCQLSFLMKTIGYSLWNRLALSKSLILKAIDFNKQSVMNEQNAHNRNQNLWGRKIG